MGECATIKGEAKALLLALIYPKSEEKMSDAERLAFGEALLLEEKYLSEIGCTGSTTGGARAVKSESVGDVSVTYDLHCAYGGWNSLRLGLRGMSYGEFFD